MELHSFLTLGRQTRQRPVGFGQQEFQNGSLFGIAQVHRPNHHLTKLFAPWI